MTDLERKAASEAQEHVYETQQRLVRLGLALDMEAATDAAKALKAGDVAKALKAAQSSLAEAFSWLLALTEDPSP